MEALIGRLREEGMEAGRAEAARLIADAEKKAREIIGQAEEEAKRRVEAARTESENMTTAAKQALNIAARDTMLDLRQQMMRQFSEDLERLVSQEMRNKDVLKALILTVAGNCREAMEDSGVSDAQVILPRSVTSLAEIRRDPETMQDDDVMRFVVSLSGGMLREGIRFSISSDEREGVRVIAKDGEIEFDLTDRAVAELLLRHLQPRFSALLEGIVK